MLDTLEKTAAAKTARNFRGIHHLALNTEDMKLTIDFYTGLLGMPLVHAMRVPPGLGTGPNNRGNPPYENLRHYFFDMGNDSLIAFFEIPRGKQDKVNVNAIAGMQHLAFAVTEETAKAIRARLEERKIQFNGPVNSLPGIQSTYFLDPNGIRLEMTAELNVGDNVQVIRSVRQTRDEAMHELRSLTDDKAWLEKIGGQFPAK